MHQQTKRVPSSVRRLPLSPRQVRGVFLLLALVALGTFWVGPARGAALPNLRVGLRLSQPQVTASAEGPHQVVNLATGALIATGQANQVWSFSLSPQGVAVASQGKTLGVFTGPIVVRPLAPVGQGNFVRVDGARYRGTLEVYRGTDGLLSLVNVLPLEEYLYGVVPAEMPSDWPLEALKAQAVAARTYARQRLGISQPGQGFDICATKYCQVYLGVNAEKPAASQAVDATRGLVLTYNGQLISAFFHASGGGYTENSENVWGEALPYLRGVPDFDQASPHFSWTAFFTPQEIQDALSREGYDLGRFYNLMPAGQPGVSGRWTTLKLEGSKGDEIIKATELRRVLNLKSTLFRIIQQTEGWQDRLKNYVSTDSVVLLGGDGRRVAKPVGMVTVLAGGSSRPVALADGRGAAGVVTAGREMVPTGIRLEGHGWGHGVGLSQWGARAMAEKGNNFQTILKYYYQGVNIEAK